MCEALNIHNIISELISRIGYSSELVSVINDEERAIAVKVEGKRK